VGPRWAKGEGQGSNGEASGTGAQQPRLQDTLRKFYLKVGVFGTTIVWWGRWGWCMKWVVPVGRSVGPIS
jgi:hypothetical protein